VPKFIDITGHRFGRLIALEPVDRERWRFRCDCGTERIAYKSNVRRGLTHSCGCLRREVTITRRTSHGHTRNGIKSKSYKTWESMLERCYNPNNKQFKDWGGRGITVCNRWRHSFENFYADMGEKPVGKLLDRINNDGNYEPGNCRWATWKQSGGNRRPAHLWDRNR